MNCQLCQKESDAYREGKLPEGIRLQVETHLGTCKVCAESFQLMRLAGKVMYEEKSMQSNPFLVTRIMAGIEDLEHNPESLQYIPTYQKVLKPLLISFSVAAAMLIGVVFGNVYLPSHPNKHLPVEMSYMNDAALESVKLFSQI